MADSLFRKKSIDNISSPEQLNDYIKVTSPGLWVIFSGIIILLVGIIVWGLFGNLNTTIETAAVCKDDTIICYIPEKMISSVDEDSVVRIDGSEYDIDDISKQPVCIDEKNDKYLMHLAGFAEGDWVYVVTCRSDIDDGTYEAAVIARKTSPIEFILN